MRAVPYIRGLSSLLSHRGWSQIWCQNRQFADFFPLHCTTQVDGMIHHPHLGNDLAHQVSVTEKPHNRTLRHDNSNGSGHCAHVGGSNVTAAKTQRHVDFCGDSIEIAARGKDNSVAAYYKPTVQLRQFLDGSAEIDSRAIFIFS